MHSQVAITTCIDSNATHRHAKNVACLSTFPGK